MFRQLIIVSVLFFFDVSNAFASSIWYSMRMELSDKLRLGEETEFDFRDLVFVDGIQILPIGSDAVATSSGAYLIADGLVDRLASFQIKHDTETTKIVESKISGDHQKILTIAHHIDVVDLTGKSLGTNDMMIGGGLVLSGVKAKPMFSSGAKCLTIKNMNVDQPVFYFSRYRSSAFKDVSAFGEFNRKESKNIVSMTTGSWSGFDWMYFKKIGFKKNEYYTAAVQYQQKVYLSSYYDKGDNVKFLQQCLAYNQVALSDIKKFFK